MYGGKRVIFRFTIFNSVFKLLGYEKYDDDSDDYKL